MLEGALPQAEFADGITAVRNVKAKGEGVRQLAYRLYTLCERQGWAEDARAYNELITSWSGIESVASEVTTQPLQPRLIEWAIRHRNTKGTKEFFVLSYEFVSLCGNSMVDWMNNSPQKHKGHKGIFLSWVMSFLSLCGNSILKLA